MAAACEIVMLPTLPDEQSRYQSAPAPPTVCCCGFLSSSYHCSSWQVVLLPARLVEQLCRPSAPALALVRRCSHRHFRGMSLLPPRRARLHTPVPPRAMHHTETCTPWLPSRGKPLSSSCCASEHTPAPPKATSHVRQLVTAFSLRLALSSLRCSLRCRQTPAASRAACVRDGRRSRRAGRHPSGAPGHSMECGSSVLMSPDGTFCPSRCQCPQRVPYLHQHCMLSMIVEWLHAVALV